MSRAEPADPHGNQPLLTAGPSPEKAAGTIIMIHGRGGSAESILALYPELEVPEMAAIAPQAAGHAWYPHSFLSPMQANQPYLDSALSRIETIVADLLTREIPGNRIALLGFSQGACLTLEFVARHPRHYGAVMGLTGGLVGPPGTARNYPGLLTSVPVFIGTSDPDPHVPFERVVETKEVLTAMGALVELRRYPGMPHTINEDEIGVCRKMLRDLTA